MRLIALVAAAGLISATAIAQPPAGAPANDTIKLIIEKGIMMSIMGFEGDVTYAADGTWTGFGGMAGTYTVDGDKLCIGSDQGSACASYPAGKKSGDSFVVMLDGVGEATVKIK